MGASRWHSAVVAVGVWHSDQLPNRADAAAARNTHEEHSFAYEAADESAHRAPARARGFCSASSRPSAAGLCQGALEGRYQAPPGVPPVPNRVPGQTPERAPHAQLHRNPLIASVAGPSVTTCDGAVVTDSETRYLSARKWR